MKQFLFIISLLLFFKPFVPLLDYAINYEYITEELCENKDDVVMQCNGKCHLMKEMAKTSEEENPISNQKNNLVKEFMPLFVAEVPTWDTLFLDEESKGISVAYSNLYTYTANTGVFHPPAVFIS